ncbi:MAG TPA: hypothetical protein VF135_00635 [Terriglobales bacterium]
MHSLSATQIILWGLAPLLQACTAALLMRRKMVKELPWFFAFLVFHVVRFSLQFPAFFISYTVYFNLFWTLEIVDSLLVLFVIQELYNRFFENYESLKGMSTIFFRSATVILFIMTIVVATRTSGTARARIVTSLFVLDRSVNVVQCALIFLLFLAGLVFGLPWRRMTRGIAIGLGVMSATFAITITLRTFAPLGQMHFFDLLQTYSYNLSVAIWLVAAWYRERVPVTTEQLPSETLQKWDTTLLEFMGK